MSLRRRPDPERVREELALPQQVNSFFGEEIVRLRRAVTEAVGHIDASDPQAAKVCLQAAIDENWWIR